MAIKTPRVPCPAGVFTDCGAGPRTIQAAVGATLLVCITADGDAQPAADTDATLIMSWMPGGDSSIFVVDGDRAWVKPHADGGSSVVTYPNL